MKFIDEARIYVKAGDGGKGCVGFFPNKGGPDGGDGGKGGSIIFKATSSKNTLIDFKFQTQYAAKNGVPGGRNNRTGADGEDLIIQVPAGTMIKDDAGKVIADLDVVGKEVVLLEGGMGGKGNTFFVNSSRQAPDYAQPGVRGGELWVNIELKLLADVGLVGLPNAGKSTLISRISAARPKIADYPFTTLVPNLGVVKYNDKDFVVADVPGLIEGAHQGSGLGIKFLKHIERTRVIVHLVDVSQMAEDPVKNIGVINNELKAFSKEMTRKPMIYVLNKIDSASEEWTQRAKDHIKKLGAECISISAVAGTGLPELLKKIWSVLEAHKKERIVLFGGSFDPPHEGHKALALHVAERFEPSKMIIMPCYIQPLKKDKDNSGVSAHDRYEMCSLFFNEPVFMVSDHEIKKEGISYTIDTAEYLSKQHPHSELYILMGEDSFMDIEKWKDHEKLLSSYNIIVVNRKGSNAVNHFSNAKGVYFVEDFEHPASATSIREHLKEGKAMDLDPKVEAYIRAKGLYSCTLK